MNDWTIVCDFDGTIAECDVTDALLERFAADAWRDIERDWRAGRIGSRECMRAQVALLDASRSDLDAVLDNVSIDPAFAQFVSDARRLGMTLQVVSDGLDYAISRILGRHGLRDLAIRANALHHDGARGWSMTSQYANDTCAVASGTCKCAIARNHGRTLLIGDGQSDFCAAGAASFVFAKDRLIGHCQRQRIAYQPILNFRDARTLLAALPELAGTSEPLFEPLPLRVQFA